MPACAPSPGTLRADGGVAGRQAGAEVVGAHHGLLAQTRGPWVVLGFSTGSLQISPLLCLPPAPSLPWALAAGTLPPAFPLETLGALVSSCS